MEDEEALKLELLSNLLVHTFSCAECMTLMRTRMG